jgi:predicted lactoylglutathione lyase
MDKQIFINLVVCDLARSKAFYSALGFVLNPQFSDESGKCMVRSDHGFMQQRSIEDFDGHTWELFYMDMSRFPAQA